MAIEGERESRRQKFQPYQRFPFLANNERLVKIEADIWEAGELGPEIER